MKPMWLKGLSAVLATLVFCSVAVMPAAADEENSVNNTADGLVPISANIGEIADYDVYSESNKSGANPNETIEISAESLGEEVQTDTVDGIKGVLLSSEQRSLVFNVNISGYIHPCPWQTNS